MFRKLLAVAVLLSFAIDASMVDAGLVFDAANDFGQENPSGVWSYGFSESGSAAFNPYTQLTDLNNVDVWRSPTKTIDPNVAHNGTDGVVTHNSTVVWQPGQLTFHPGPDGELSILRFIAPISGNYFLTSEFTGTTDTNGATTSVTVLDGNSEIYQVDINGDTHSFSDSLNLLAGEIVDFRVGARGNYASDTTGIEAVFTLQSVPEPSSAILIFFALTSLLARRQRRFPAKLQIAKR